MQRASASPLGLPSFLERVGPTVSAWHRRGSGPPALSLDVGLGPLGPRPSALSAEIRTPPPPPRSSMEAWALPHRLPPPPTSRRISSPAVDEWPRLGRGCPVSESPGSSAAVRRTSRGGPKGGSVDTGMSLGGRRLGRANLLAPRVMKAEGSSWGRATRLRTPWVAPALYLGKGAERHDTLVCIHLHCSGYLPAPAL